MGTKLVLNAAHILEYLKMVSPTEEDLIKAVRDIRLQDPTLARAKVLKHLKDENGWELSEKRLKACMDANNLGAVAPTLDSESLKPRDDAFEEILKEVFSDLTRLEREFYLDLRRRALSPMARHPRHILHA